MAGRPMSSKLAETKMLFAKNGIDTSDAEWIFSIVLGIKRSSLGGARDLTPSEEAEIDSLTEKRLGGTPLWYVIGDTEFYGCTIKTDDRALIPRPETELLAQCCVRLAKDGDRILDLCTGSGCIAVSVMKKCMEAGIKISVTASDISGEALSLAGENAVLNGTDICFTQSDMLSDIVGTYDMIVCNPPYVPTVEMLTLSREIVEHEPLMALDGGEDGLDFFRILAKDAPRHIRQGGYLLLECGEGQAMGMKGLFKGYKYYAAVKDLSGTDRFVIIAF